MLIDFLINKTVFPLLFLVVGYQKTAPPGNITPWYI